MVSIVTFWLMWSKTKVRLFCGTFCLEANRWHWHLSSWIENDNDCWNTYWRWQHYHCSITKKMCKFVNYITLWRTEISMPNNLNCEYCWLGKFKQHNITHKSITVFSSMYLDSKIFEFSSSWTLVACEMLKSPVKIKISETRILLKNYLF